MKITKTFFISTVDDLAKYVIHSNKVLASEIAGLKIQYAVLAVGLGLCWISNIRMNNLTNHRLLLLEGDLRERLEKELKEESKNENTIIHNTVINNKDKDEEM